MKIIGYYCSNGILVNSEFNYTNKSPYLDFILQDHLGEDTIKVFYNINHDVASLLKAIQLTQVEGKALIETEELFLKPSYKLKYVPGKFFSIGKGAYWCYLGDISQYINTKFEEHETLDTCKQKALEAARVGKQIWDSLVSLGLNPTTITSPIRAFEKEKLDKLDLPIMNDIPSAVAEYAYECCDASWLEGYRIGHWDNVYDFDLCSAYPFQTSKLLDIRNGKWERTTKYESSAIYGYYNCQVEIYPTTKVSPIMYVIKNNNNDYNRNFTPVGTWNRILTKKQIDFIYHWNLGKVAINDGYVWTKEFKDEYPFKDTMEWLYSEKEKNSLAGDGQRKDTIKRIMSGVYGKFLETQRRKNEETHQYERIFGERFNPVYAAEIEVNTKLEDADFMFRNNMRPIHIAVDGIVSLDSVKSTSEITNEFGGWRLNNQNECLSISTGVIAIKGKFELDPEAKKDFSLDYDWLINAIKENPDSRVYTMKKLSPITLAIAVKDGCKRWDELGSLQNISRSINIGYEEKRLYKQMPRTGKENLECDLESYPLDVSLLERAR